MKPSAIAMSTWYFDRYEDRQPLEPMPASAPREFAFQVLASAAVVLGALYLYWRWTASLNPDALWFSIPLAIAETFAMVGSLLFFLSIWRTRDTPQQPPPRTVNDILAEPVADDRPLRVDMFFPTYNEEVELVRLSIRDAKRVRYPAPIDLRIWVLDDGKRPAMKAVADEEGVGYLTRSSNVGFKAGNLRNALDQTDGDLIVICDADTRPFPAFLEETLGYFRDPQVAWVQTPQWFFDLDPGVPLPELLGRKLGRVGRALGSGIQKIIGPVDVGADPLGSDPTLFYDIIQRRRNWCNAAFCCGAGSIHRREAIMEAALKGFGAAVDASVKPHLRGVHDVELKTDLESALTGEAARALEFTPYKFHVSEDIYTSLALHSDRHRGWRSVYHPRVLSKMLSPQDLLSWSIQRFKYAGGTLDIARNDNPLAMRGLSAWQKLMYGTSIYSYIAPLWTVVFLCAPAVYFFTGAAPVRSYGAEFWAHIIPFLLVNRLAYMVGTWGVKTWRGEQFYLAFFWLNLRAVADVIRKKPIKFHVTPKTKQANRYPALVAPHLVIVGATVLGILYRGALVFTGNGGDPAAFAANLFWSAITITALHPMIRAALSAPKAEVA